jgi:MFS family permease
MESKRVLGCSLFEAFSLSLIVPLMNDYGMELGLGRKYIGLAGSLYGAIQLFSSPAIGALSDSLNRGSVLALSQALVGASYIILASSLVFASLPLFFVSRVCTGLFKHTSLVTKALVTDTCDDGGDRATAIGLLYTSSAVAFAVGPAVGGLLAERAGLAVNGFLAGFGYCCCAAFSYWFIAPASGRVAAPAAGHSNPPPLSQPTAKGKQVGEPTAETNTLASTAEPQAAPAAAAAAAAQQHQHQSPQNPGTNVDHDDDKGTTLGRQALTLLVVRLAIGFAMISFFSSYRFFVQDKLDLGPVGLGYVTSVYSTGSIVAQTFLVGLLRRRMSEHAMAVRAAVLMGLGILCVAICPASHAAWTGAALLFVAMSSSTLRIAFSLLLTEASPSSQRGKVLGLADSVMSVARVAAPGCAGFLSECHSAAPLLGSAVLLVLAACMIQLTVSDPLAKHQQHHQQQQGQVMSLWNKLCQRRTAATQVVKSKTQ